MENKNLNISFFIKELLVRDLMAYILDLARISEMGDRQFNQFERSIKDKIYEVIKEGNDRLLEFDTFSTAPTSDITANVKRSKNDAI